VTNNISLKLKNLWSYNLSMTIKTLLETINDAEQHVNDLKDKYWILLHSVSFTPKYKKKKPAKPVFVLKNKSIGGINIVQNYVKYYEHGTLECELNRNQFTFYHENGTIDVDYDSSGQISRYYDDGTLYYIGTCVLLDYDDVVKRVSDNEFYSDDEFIFVKGKEYYEIGELKYEGKYEEGAYKMGKEYFINGKLYFEGEYEEGQYKKGKEYSNGKLCFEGEYEEDLRQKGKEYSNGKLCFEGEYEEGEYKKGKEYYETGELKYKGEWVTYEYYGLGKEYYENGRLKYENNGVHTIAYYPDHYKIRMTHTNRLGKEYYETGELKYEGEFKGQFREGQGKEYYETGELKYEGTWVKDKYNMHGKEYYENGNIKFDGSWCGGNFIEGKYYVGVFLYEGECASGKYLGKCKLYINNELAYYGHWNDHKRHGLGKKYYVNEIKYAHRQTEYDGEWVNDVRHGKGKEYDKNGRLTYDGEWVRGKRKTTIMSNH